jgi:8-oxo-dGTP pyrophosphatase MutT (NUDIX family)
MDPVFRERLAAALSRQLPYGEKRPVPDGSRHAGVLLLFGTERDRLKDPRLLITRRTDSVGTHKGEMAFPGGVSEADEIIEGARGLVRTALRETHEEIGIPPSAVTTVGALPELTTITDYRVTPVVGLLREPVEEFPFRLNTNEIAEAFWVRLETLREPGVYRTELVRVGKVDYPIHVYQVGEHRIWGATGAMIKNLLDRLQALG